MPHDLLIPRQTQAQRQPLSAAPLLIALIPARNEETTIAEVVRAVLAAPGREAVVIDDHSSDATRLRAREAGATVLPLPFHAGAWCAIQTGFRYAMTRDCRAALTLDADGQHPVADIDRLVAGLASGADVAVGRDPQRVNFPRQCAWSLFRRLGGVDLVDLTSGMKAYSRRAMELLLSDDALLLDYQDLGSLLFLRQAGMRVVECDVSMRPRQFGTSRVFPSWRSVARYGLQTLLLALTRPAIATPRKRTIP
jgi:glycosyltransferase involved in cell wall biosynthesis